MTAGALLAELRGLGVELEIADGRPRWRAPAGRMTDALLALVRDHKPALVELLEAEEAAIAWRAEAMRPAGTEGGLPSRTVEGRPPTADGCRCCGEPSPYGALPRCTYCALAADRIIEEKRAAPGSPPRPAASAPQDRTPQETEDER